MRELVAPSSLNQWKGVNQRLQPTLVPDGFFCMSKGLYFGLGNNAERLTGKVLSQKFNGSCVNLFPWGNGMVVQRQFDTLFTTLPDFGRIEQPFIYISDGDAHGIFYGAGLRAGGGSWVNPSGVTVTITGSNIINGVAAELTNRVVSDVYTSNVAGSWFKVDWTAGREVQVNKWSYRARNFPGSFPTAFKLQGSQDDSSWTDIQAVTGIIIVSDAWLTSTPSGPQTFYRYHRLLWTAVDSSGFDFATIGEWEFYGKQYVP